MGKREVTVVESGAGRFGQFITAGHHVLGADEPEPLGGRDTGPDPYELLLSGLGACTAMTLRMYAERKHMALTKVSVHLRHVARAAEGNASNDAFERIITLEGDLSDADRQRLLDVADRCPVSQTLQRGSRIASSLAPLSAGAAT
jgi:putative redox protein